MNTKNKTTLTIRVDRKTKADAKMVLSGMGMDMSTAINVFLKQVITDKGLPFTPSALSPLDKATKQAEADLAAGRVHHYSNFDDYQEGMDRL